MRISQESDMAKFSLYNIPLKSLAAGKHQFKYDLDDSFFKLIEDEAVDIKRGQVAVIVDIKAGVTAFDFTFDIKGTVHVPCDRCLDEIAMEVETHNKLVVKFGKEYSEESDEIVVIPEDDGEINIAWFLYEFIALCLPMKKVHASGLCNKAMSSKLNKHKVSSSGDDNSDNDDDDMDSDDDSSTDSRWDSLKDLPAGED